MPKSKDTPGGWTPPRHWPNARKDPDGYREAVAADTVTEGKERSDPGVPQRLTRCGCYPAHEGKREFIHFCPLHAQAGAMRKALQDAVSQMITMGCDCITVRHLTTCAGVVAGAKARAILAAIEGA